MTNNPDITQVKRNKITQTHTQNNRNNKCVGFKDSVS